MIFTAPATGEKVSARDLELLSTAFREHAPTEIVRKLH